MSTVAALIDPRVAPDFYPGEDAGEPWLDGRISVRLALPTVVGSFVWDEAVWDTGAFGGLTGWVDITCWVRSIAITRGRTPFGETFEAGVATITLDNRDGRFSAWNRRSPYATLHRSAIAPGVGVQVWWGHSADLWDTPGVWDESSTWGGLTTWYGLFAGIAESFDESWPGTTDAEVVLTATDGFRDLAAVDLAPLADVDAVGLGETTGERVQRLLDLAVFRWPTLVADGTTSVLATTYGQTVIDLLRLTVLSEGGEMWVTGDGTFRFDDANTTETRWTTPQAVFTDDCADGTLPYIDPGPTISTDDSVLANHVLIGNTGGAFAMSTDADSDAVFGPRWLRRDALIFQPTAHAAALADRLLDERAWAATRVAGVAVDSLVTRGKLIPRTVGALELRDAVRIVRTFAEDTVDTVVAIEGIDHAITPERWVCQLATADIVDRAPIPPVFGPDGWDISRYQIGAWG